MIHDTLARAGRGGLAALALLAAPACVAGAGYQDLADDDSSTAGEGDEYALLFWSPSIAVGGSIPAQFTCDGADHSPPLRWIDVPATTESFAVVMVDQDAGNFGHWGVYDIPATVESLAEGASPNGALPAGANELVNDFYLQGYGGPCTTEQHRFAITLIAVSEASLNLPPYATFDELLVEAHAVGLEFFTFTGVYGG